MQEGIHPNYELTKITCVCGNVIETRSTVKTSMLKFVQLVTLSLQENKNWLTQLVVLNALTNAITLNKSSNLGGLKWTDLKFFWSVHFCYSSLCMFITKKQ